MSWVQGAPIRRRRDGRYSVRFDVKLRTVLASIAEQLGPMIDAEDPATTRLFPPAYAGDDEPRYEGQYRSLVDSALRGHHHRALDELIATAQADTLSAAELEAWLSAIGSMRLVLGTRLDVSEETADGDPDDPDADERILYDVLGSVQAIIIDVLAAELPDEGSPDRSL